MEEYSSENPRWSTISMQVTFDLELYIFQISSNMLV